jgi:Bacteriocin-protection, YdeI or OmpD-Associated/Domain of unknown function (DUF1905)
MTSTLKSQRFLATVYKIWMMRHVDVPEEVSAALLKQLAPTRMGKKKGIASKPKYIPAVAIVNGRSARVTLVPSGGGRYRMQINTALRKAAGVDAGDLVSVALRLDRDSRERPVPADLRAGLKKCPKAQMAFNDLTPAHRRHIIEYFDSAKSKEARQRRLERIVDMMLERALLQPKRRSRAARPAGAKASS